jgi:hypothetical protein
MICYVLSSVLNGNLYFAAWMEFCEFPPIRTAKNSKCRNENALNSLIKKFMLSAAQVIAKKIVSFRK